jgi:uncharacterized protein (TIGR03067 family)
MKLILALCALSIISSPVCPTMKAEEIQGEWSCVSAVIDGKALPKSTVMVLRLKLTADRFRTERESEVLFDSTYTLNSSAEPRQINMTGTEGDLAGKEAQGIYLLEGNTLKICYTMPGQKRPATFESLPGSKAYLITWTRQK